MLSRLSQLVERDLGRIEDLAPTLHHLIGAKEHIIHNLIESINAANEHLTNENLTEEHIQSVIKRLTKYQELCFSQMDASAELLLRAVNIKIDKLKIALQKKVGMERVLRSLKQQPAASESVGQHLLNRLSCLVSCDLGHIQNLWPDRAAYKDKEAVIGRLVNAIDQANINNTEEHIDLIRVCRNEYIGLCSGNINYSANKLLFAVDRKINTLTSDLNKKRNIEEKKQRAEEDARKSAEDKRAVEEKARKLAALKHAEEEIKVTKANAIIAVKELGDILEMHLEESECLPPFSSVIKCKINIMFIQFIKRFIEKTHSELTRKNIEKISGTFRHYQEHISSYDSSYRVSEKLISAVATRVAHFNDRLDAENALKKYEKERQLAAEQQRLAEEARKAAVQRAVEEANKTPEQRAAEDEARKAAEALRVKEQERREEAYRKEQERIEEAYRVAEQERLAAEQQRLAEEKAKVNPSIHKNDLIEILKNYHKQKGFFRKHAKWIPFVRSETQTISDLRGLLARNQGMTVSQYEVTSILGRRDERNSHARKTGFKSSDVFICTLAFFHASKKPCDKSNNFLANLSETERAVFALAKKFAN